MIRENSGFWDSIESTPGSSGDERTYDANDITVPFRYLVTDGVQTGGTFLQVTPGEYDYSSQIAPGMAWIRGRWYILWDDGTGGPAQKILLHDAPIQYSRIDRVVLRYDANYTLAGQKITAVVLKGEEGETPVPPALTRMQEIYELSLAQVLIKPGQPIVLSEDITDERFDGDLCGIVEFAPEPNLQPKINEFTAQLTLLFEGAEDILEALIAQLSAGGVPADMVSTQAPVEHPTWTDGQTYLAGLHAKVAEHAAIIPAKIKLKTLVAANWSGGAITMSDADILATSPGDVCLAQSASLDQFKAWSAAKPQVTAQEAGQITITARGKVPTIDVPVFLEVRA